MLDIKKIYKETHIEYYFMNQLEISDLNKIENMFLEDSNMTYKFIFNFHHLDYMNTNIINMMKKIFLICVEHACDIVIKGLNTQPTMMFEIFQLDKLYSIEIPVDQDEQNKIETYDDLVYA